MFYISISSSTNHSQSLCFIAARSLDYWWILFAIQSRILRLQSDLSCSSALPLFFRGPVSEDQECLRRIDLSSFISAPSLRTATLHWVKTWSALEGFLLLFLSPPSAFCVLFTCFKEKGPAFFRKDVSQLLSFIWFLLYTLVYLVKANGKELVGRWRFSLWLGLLSRLIYLPGHVCPL